MPASYDTTGILTSVLEKGETLAYLAGDVDCRIMQEYTADAAHWFLCQTRDLVHVEGSAYFCGGLGR